MKKTLLLFAVLGVMVTVSCNKDDNTVSTVSSFQTYSSMDTIYQMLEVKPKYVTVNGAAGGTFYGNSGTRYVIPPNCLQDASGNPVTTNVQFEVAEYLKKGDMIFSKMLPVSDGEPLFSGGEISIHATQSGLPVYLKPGCPCTANIPQVGKADTGMRFFAGQIAQDKTNTFVNWKPVSDTVRTKRLAFVTAAVDTISIISDSLTICNGDHFMANHNFQAFKVSVVVAGLVVSDTTRVKAFALFDSHNAAYPLHNQHCNTPYDENHMVDIPTHFIAYTLVNNRFYGGIIAVTPKTGEQYSITLTEVDPTAFKGQLNNLSQ